jgi:translation initiation factor RLI1
MESLLQVSGPINTFSGIINGTFYIEKGQVALLKGANGIGKSSFIQYLKLNLSLRDNVHLSFLDQLPLHSLNSLSTRELLSMLENDFDDFHIKGVLKEFKEKNLSEQTLSTQVNKLSGGENQLLKLIICLGFDSELYVMDEPSTFLDTHKISELLKLIELYLKIGKSFLLVEHRSDYLNNLNLISYELIRTKSSSSELELIKYGK